MRFAGGSGGALLLVVGWPPPLSWPRLITAHEKRWHWRCDPYGPIHYPASCTLPPQGKRHFHRFKVTMMDIKRRGRGIKWGGEGKRDEDSVCPQGDVTLRWRVWLTNALNLWSIQEPLSLSRVCGWCKSHWRTSKWENKVWGLILCHPNINFWCKISTTYVLTTV